MMDIIFLLLAVVGLCSANCLPGIRRVRDRQTDENITAAEDIWDCLESRRNHFASKQLDDLKVKLALADLNLEKKLSKVLFRQFRFATKDLVVDSCSCALNNSEQVINQYSCNVIKSQSKKCTQLLGTSHKCKSQEFVPCGFYVGKTLASPSCKFCCSSRSLPSYAKCSKRHRTDKLNACQMAVSQQLPCHMRQLAVTVNSEQ